VTDDIVTRLRNWVLRDTPSETLELEAADEIERLRTELNKWVSIGERFAESHPQHDAFHAYFKARFRD
jgi:hypothetical protein